MTERGGRQRWFLPLVIGLAIVAAVAATLAVVSVVGDDENDQASVVLEPIGSSGPDPFSKSVASSGAAPSDAARATAATVQSSLPDDTATGTLVADGATPGLFGGSGTDQACNPDQLVRFLRAEPEKASAWAKTLGIRPSSIGSYVASLAPVRLTADTWVTNHGYSDGAATPRQSVLQAGTAVFVDAEGVPRVRCSCGNPLTPPATGRLAATTTGNPWPDFTTAAVVIVNPAPAPSTSLTVIDPSTGDLVEEPVAAGSGSWLAIGGQVDQSKTPVLASSDAGTTWSEIASVDGGSLWGITYGDGRWVAVGTDPDRTRGFVVESDDGRTWDQVAVVDDPLYSIAFGSDRWVAVGGDTEGVVYSSPDGDTWSRSTSPAPPASTGWDASYLTDVAYGNGRWAAIATRRFTQDPSELSGDEIPGTRVLTSNDATAWTYNEVTSYPAARIGFGGGQWLLSGTDGYYGSFSRTLARSADTVTWTPVATPPPHDGSEAIGYDAVNSNALAYGGGTWILGGTSRSGDGVTWSPTGSTTGVRAMVFGPGSAPEVATREEATPEPATPAPAAPVACGSVETYVGPAATVTIVSGALACADAERILQASIDDTPVAGGSGSPAFREVEGWTCGLPAGTSRSSGRFDQCSRDDDLITADTAPFAP